MQRQPVLVLASTYPRWRGDPEPGFVHELCARLTERYSVTVLCPHSPGAPSHEQMDGVEIHRYRYAPERLETLVFGGGILHNLRQHRWKWLLVPGFLLVQAWALWRLVRRLRPRVIHAHWLVPQGFIAAAMGRLHSKKIPLLVTSHGSDLFSLKGGLLKALKRFTLKRADALTVVSRAMLGPAQALGANPARTSVQPMGVDLQGRFCPDPSQPRAATELLFVGRLVEKKGLQHLLAAMPAIRKAHPTASLTVAGFGPENDARRNQVARLGMQDYVRFIGAVDQAELPALYRRASLLIAPFVEASSGDQEGFGLVLVEAMGCECPVLASDVPAIRDTIEPGANGWLAQPASAADLARQAITLLADAELRQRLAAQGRRDSLRFDWPTVADGYSNRIAELATRSA